MLSIQGTSLSANMLRLLSYTHPFHTFTRLNTASVDKKLLSELRKKTGFTFVNCKKALQQFEGDLDKAEVWLREQAQKEGWQKASKLQGRPMSQGLISVMVRGKTATMIEMNCETDFVARNKKFQELVQKLTICCQSYFDNCTEAKMLLSKDHINQIKHEEGPLSDLVAKEVGNIGENMALRRGAFLQTSSPSAVIGSYVHSMQGLTKVGDAAVGRFGALVALQPSPDVDVDEQTLVEVSQRLSQHVVGLNPTKIGDPEKDKPAADKDQEKVLIYQEFLLDAEKTVGEYLTEKSLTVQHFVRFECGEELGEVAVQQKSEAAAAVSS